MGQVERSRANFLSFFLLEPRGVVRLAFGALHGQIVLRFLLQGLRVTLAGCIAGLHEVLRRQGLFEGVWCLDPRETLSPGQKEEIDRVYRAYPELHDDEFVREGRDKWLKP